ncbi:MAG: hypothetical protein Q7T61_00955 [Caulobacter sp.]|nr:hypothetical protein [Caulobacter sp.]
MADVAETEALEVTDPAVVEDTTAEPTLEDIARKAGWSPKEEWRGDEKDWKPASAFLTETATSAKDIRSEMRALRKEIEATGKTTAKMAADFKAKAIEEAEARIREFTEANDPEAVLKATRDLAKIEAEPVNDPIKAWVAENPWFNTDTVAEGIARGAAEKAAKAGKNTAEQLAAARAEVMKRMPELFTDDDAPATPAARRSPPVLTGGTRNAAPTREPGFADLPPSARTAFATLVSQGMAQETAEGRKQYATTWLKFNGKAS